MKLTGYYMTAICKFGAVVQSADIVNMRNLLNLADMDGVI